MSATSKDVLAYLRNVIFNDPKRWVKQAWAKNSKGAYVKGVTDKNADCFCMLGGIYRSIHELGIDPESLEGQKLHREAIVAVYSAAKGKKVERASNQDIFNWNDSNTRKFDEIQKAVVEAPNYL